jgi:site-specific recombinase XerD
MNITTKLSGLLEAFFTERLMRQRCASPHTIAAYRDAFRLLLRYAKERLKKAPSALTLADLEAPFISSFLDHLENERGNSVRSRNLRLAAIHSFFRYIAFQEPGQAELIQRVLAIPIKRHDRALVAFLSRAEVEALLKAPDSGTWGGRRDYALLLVAVQTGLRVSELTGLRCEDAVLRTGSHIRCRGKGRKERCTPLTKKVATTLRSWLKERGGNAMDPLFPNARGGRLSRDGVEYLLAKHVAQAQRKCPSLRRKRVSPHVLRHTTAMNLLRAGVGRSVIALYLGHESVETTQIYFDADLALKEQILSKVAPLPGKAGRYRPGDRLLSFLNSL